MKVLFLTSAFPSKEYPKSNAHNLRSITNLSSDPEIEMQVVHLRSWRPWRRLYSKTKLYNLEIISFSFPYYPNLLKFLLCVLFGLYKRVLFHLYLKKEIHQYDVIHTAGVEMESFVGAYIKKKTGIPHVAQCMGSDVNTGLPKLKNIIGWKGNEKYIDIFSCNSKSLQEQLKTIYPNVYSKVIYRGVNLKEFSYSKMIPNKITRFLYLGGLVGNKDVDKFNLKGGVTLLNAWKGLIESNKINKEGIELVFCGPNASSDLIKTLINDNPKNYNVKVEGRISIENVKKLIKESHVIVIPSMNEGLPNVAMEAAAVGRPVIGSDAGGIPEIVINNKTGFIFTSKDSEALSKLITQYCENRELIISHGNTARKYVESNFDSNKFRIEMKAIYESLITSSQSRI